MPKVQADQLLRFGPYRLDPASGQVWRGKQEVNLTPKALAVLRHLIQQPGQVVTKEEFFRVVWSDTVVSDAALTSCIQELRQALHDEARNPRYIETVHRRGFRFVAAVQSSRFKVQSSKTEPAPSTQHPAPTLVGRDVEFVQLHGWLEKALHGERQLVFVTGESGIGKTTLVDAFLAQVAAEGTTWLGRGQCIEHYGAGEAYLPLLEALGRLCREPDGQRVRTILERSAPSWLVQLPALLTNSELEALQRKVAGVTKERMLRELAEAIEVLTVERPLVLWLEDLHWSDVSTLDWLAVVARRRERARLLVLGTYRPVDVLVREHPLKAVKQELQLHGHCQELALDFLGEEHVAEYLVTRFGVGAVRDPALRGLAGIIHRRTDGNPLFIVNLVDYLLSQGVLVQRDGQWTLKGEKEALVAVPETLQQMIAQRLAQVTPTARALLEVASVAGAEFSAAAVAAGAETAVEAVEEQCAELARRESFLQIRGTADWPDGTVATRYGFLHALYQEVLYERLPAGRRQRLHQRIGEREEAAYGERTREIATELAIHFEQGRDYQRAVQYLQRAGENAVRRSAYQEALSLLTKGLELLQMLPDTPERARQEITLQLTLSAPLGVIKSPGAPEAERACTRALELCRQLGETPHLLPALLSLSGLSMSQGKLQTSRELAEQSLTLAQRAQDRALLVVAHNLLGSILHSMGELVLAREHLEQAFALYDPQQHRPMFFMHFEPGVFSSFFTASVLGLLGYPDQAVQRIQAALSLAYKLSHPLSLAYALSFAATVHQLRREAQAAQEYSEAMMALAREQGFAFPLAGGTMLRGWALAAQGRAEESVAQMLQSLPTVLATGSEVVWPYYLALLAEAYERLGQVEEGLAVLAEALAMVRKTGQYVTEGELYRLKGELVLQSGVRSPESKPPNRNPQLEVEAEACFHKAIEIARKQQAKSWELRAVMSLSRLWQKQSKKEEARHMLAEIYDWFTEGFDTADLKEAKVLLEELSH